MHAIQITQTGGPEVLHYREVPTPEPAAGEALVRVTVAGVNFIDVYHRIGRYPQPLPFIPGVEGAGKVEQLGAGVSDVSIGQHVCWSGMRNSGYAEYTAVPASQLIPVPAGVSDEAACAALLQGMTAHMLVNDVYPLKAGETALVHAAAGGVGLLLVQMAKRKGARVIATVSTEAKAALAREAGAAEVILYTQQDFETETKRLAEGGVHVVYDSVGKDTFEKGLNVLRPRGMMVIYGASSGPAPHVDPITLMNKGSLFLTRPTLFHYNAERPTLLTRAAEVFDAVSAAKLKVTIGKTYALKDAAQAHMDLESRATTGKLLLRPE
ncbi:MAG: quinone oxidoreductase family protein [Anaerolineales bacterium]